MSQFITKLREERDEQGQTGRDGIEWPTPLGTWKQGESINRLETFANNLDVSQSPGDTDLLNSVPTPWARLLLFETALYKPKHPSHKDVEDQWRGLLGIIALAEPLSIKIEINTIELNKHYNSKIARTFANLRPHYVVNNTDVEALKWNEFQMIKAGNAVLGSTSPRTLVFTGVAHQCPPSIPFRSPQGRLSDPVAYYKKYGDTFYLGLLAYWINSFINNLQQDQVLREWMGEIPAAPGAASVSRLNLFMDRLKAWQKDLNGAQPQNISAKLNSRFTLSPFGILKGLPTLVSTGDSNLFLRGRRDVIVCYHPQNGSKLVNAFDQELINEPLKVYDGLWIQANQPLPLPLNFLPPNIQVIEDPVALFEDKLIQVNLPANPDAVHYLKVGDERNSRTYLLPFKKEILKFFSPSEIAENTKIVQNPQTNSLRVELSLPLESNRTIKASREYPLDSSVIVNTPTAQLAVWPDFTCPVWDRYFYFKASVARQEVNFEPIIEFTTSRTKSNHTWYATRKPAEAFIGSVNDNKGLLLIQNNKIDPPDKFWKLGVDFGSTHTRAFSLLLEKRGDEYVTSPGATIQPIRFRARARALTFVDEQELRDTFLALVGQLSPPERDELKTLLMMPEPNPIDDEKWLAREGYVYMHSILSADYDPDHLRYNLKWNSHKNDPELRAFLRCLLLMIEAEAIRQGSQVVSITHTYPSVFSEGLIAKHNGEWRDLEQYLNTEPSHNKFHVQVQEATMTETVAVCRHLEWEQGALPSSNTISLDVGGSTTDIAVWAESKLKIQESVKMAAGIMGRYLQSADAQEFLQWFEPILQGAPYNYKNFRIAPFGSKPSGYSLMFTNLLTVIEGSGNMNVLLNQINGAKQSRKLLSHIIYLYSSVLYYAGLLARRANLPQQQDTYYIYFCGKGGTLIKWIRGYEVLAQQMFEAGLFGPSGRGKSPAPTVIAKLSVRPKEEVGRGLLALSALQGNPKSKGIGLVDPNPPSVTVGETGYQGLQWNAELNPASLTQLPKNTVPPIKDLLELTAFIKAFEQGSATQAAAKELKIDTVSPNLFNSKLIQRLFGTTKGCVVTDIENNDPDALLEPMFITEAKVLLETATQNAEIFT